MPDRLHNRPALKAFRRNLRTGATAPEKVLWGLLRGRGLGGRKFRRQHSVGRYVLDFYCPAERLAIELDGGVHDDPARATYDAEREAYLRAQGIRVVRLPNAALVEAPVAVAAWLASHLAAGGSPSPPPPAPPGQEGGE